MSAAFSSFASHTFPREMTSVRYMQVQEMAEIQAK